MFDPHHNAVDEYYLVNGSLEGLVGGPAARRDHRQLERRQGEGEPRRSSPAAGHRQIIAGYYDVDDLSNFQSWDAAARGVKGVIGFMYTTWSARYSLLDRYGAELRKAR